VKRKGSLTSSMLLSLRGVNMEKGRSDLDALLKEEVSMASGSMSVSGKHEFHRHQEYATYGHYISLRIAGYSTRGPSCTSFPCLWTFQYSQWRAERNPICRIFRIRLIIPLVIHFVHFYACALLL
jgi:hypothetical protein